MRKIIQVSFAAYQGSMLVALCNDGSVWFADSPYLTDNNNIRSNWIRLKDIPQDPPIESPEEELKNKQGSERWNELLSQCDPSIKTKVNFTGIKDIDLNDSSCKGINRHTGRSITGKRCRI